MNKQELQRDIKKEIGNFPNQTDIADYLGKSREYVRKMMYGVECLSEGKSKRYFSGDIATRIMERRTI